jgi:LysR family transcriptional regulator, hca operon transcriptional activator
LLKHELSALRYFIAVGEEGSFIRAAEQRLRTAQPSLSRQIRDLELQVGIKLLEHQARGVTLTAAGRVFLHHARLALSQIETAGEAARRAAQPDKPVFVIVFLSGQEVAWLPEALRILRQESPDTEISISSHSSPELAAGLMQRKVDVAILRREKETTGLVFKFLIKEPLITLMPATHRRTARKTVRPQDVAREIFVGPAQLAPVLKSVIKDYAAKVGITLQQKYDAEDIYGGMSLLASTGGVTLLPLYVQNMLIPSVVARPLQGEPPTINLDKGYNKSNTSALLKRFMSRADELVVGVRKQNSLKSIQAR